MQVSIKRIHPDVELPEYKTGGSVAFDIATNEDRVIAPKEMVLLGTGLIISTPPGYMLMLAARSSLGKKQGLVMRNGVGVIDQDYCGPEDELHLLVYNFTESSVELKKGQRIAQGIFVRIDRAEWNEVSEMYAPTRGGFGSTDK